ncbi:MarR family transcriptional regulator [Serratia marcescens]|uniref:MarR family winged helix-turn-helix transcriptional regulator n=1 Tax=Serratia marcescens TaxID=615 RepID=UPI0030D5F134
MSSKEKSLYALTNALQPVRRVWKQAATLAIAKSGISMSLATVVVLVHRNPQGINQRDLAEEVGVNPGALVRLLDQAAALGFLERQESAGDRRFKTLRILPAGAELAQKVEAAADKLRVELMHDVPLEDIETATRILRLFEERAGHYLQQAGNEP